MAIALIKRFPIKPGMTGKEAGNDRKRSRE